MATRRERRIALSRKHGFAGTDAELAVKGKALAALLRSWQGQDLADFLSLPPAEKEALIMSMTITTVRAHEESTWRLRQ